MDETVIEQEITAIENEELIQEMEEFIKPIEEETAVGTTAAASDSKAPTSELKVWHYTEKNEKNVIHHTLSLTKDRLIHRAESAQSKHSTKQRTDIALKNVHSVNASYGYARNVGLAMFLGIMSFLCLVAGIVLFIKNIAAIGGALLGATVIFGIAAFLVYKKVKPSFVLEICTIGAITSDLLAYGNSVKSVTKQHGKFPFFRLFFIIALGVGTFFLIRTGKVGELVPGFNNIYMIAAVAAVALILLILPRGNSSARSVGKVGNESGKYSFEMDYETGIDIVDTIGELIIENQNLQ